MAFTAQTEDKESLQALAFALRQEKGSEIEYAEVECKITWQLMLKLETVVV